MFLTEPEIILFVVFQKKANLNNFENEMEKLNGKLKNMFIISQIAMVTEFEKKQ